jgi:histidinol-phosphate phosphatase family protein
MKQVIILAGGKGTRLQDRLGDLPKPLIDICGKPLLERQIELLKKFGYTHALLLLNHGARKIENYCASRNNWGINVECINDGDPRGTAGATLAVIDRLSDEFLVMYGDTMLEVDLQRFQAFHHSRSDVAATLFVHPNDHPHDSDLVEVEEKGLIKAFHPYPHDMGRYYPNLVNAALYYFRRDALKPWRGTPGLLDFGKDLFPAMLAHGDVLLGYNSPEYIKDCGTPSRLDKVCADFTLGRISRASLDLKQCAVFLDRDGVINKEVKHISRHEQFELLPGVENAIRRFNSSEYRTIVVTNQPVIARGDCSPAMLTEIHNKMESLLGHKGVYLDHIYFCPHHPDRGYVGEVIELKIECNCRKPKTGMIEQAVNELNIDLQHSWLIGDSTVDLLTAQRAGLLSILVETGFSGLDGRHWIAPDFIMPDMQTAANFILEDFPRLLTLCEKLGAGIGAGDFVFIGGLSRSGKSNIAGCLRHILKTKGQRTVVLKVDHWLHNEAERAPGVLGRYDINALHTIITQLSKRSTSVTLDLPFYDKVGRRRLEGVKHITVEKDDIVIVEGTIALLLMDTVDERASHSWFIEMDEDERRKRVLREYRQRKFSAEEAEAIYTMRQQDETPVVLDSAESALHRIALQLGVSVGH